MNTPPVLVLANPAAVASGGGIGYAAVLYESERTTAVAVADGALSLTDVDSAVLPRATVSLYDTLDGSAEARGAERAAACMQATGLFH